MTQHHFFFGAAAYRDARPARTLAACLFAFVAGLASASSYAHSVLEDVTPAPNSTVHGSPKEVKVVFSQPIELSFSTLRVLDKSGKQMNKDDKGSNKDDKRSDDKGSDSAADPKVLVVPLPTLQPGSYRIIWRALAKDGHVTKGESSFKVIP
jgi:methionine-rich copper-binding protein CopC